ncbi:hypothetical protein KTI63_07215 [Acinetobacter guillouiae]|uniref:hypothetical protein n=1 Tax=Acinetobacter guillouiae TaxID=106649 RepID=UPI0021D39008|nr:hypothetical protein [Acinetobacter guillouiae]MCU4492262.1 hypothetical protein [Acinetobacter guillouiae]
MFKPKISFKNKKWTCKQCGLLIEYSKWKIKIGAKVFFTVPFFDKNFNYLNKTIKGTVIDRQNKFLMILDSNMDTYFIDQSQVFLQEAPALFLYNMYGKCACKQII